MYLNFIIFLGGHPETIEDKTLKTKADIIISNPNSQMYCSVNIYPEVGKSNIKTAKLDPDLGKLS